MILSSEDLLSVLTKLLHVLESQTEENRNKKLLLSCLKAFSNLQRTYIHGGHLLSIELTKNTLGLSVLSLCAHSLLGYKKKCFLKCGFNTQSKIHPIALQ